MIQCVMDSFGIREEVKERKKSWSELKREVCELRRQLGRLSIPVPTSISFRTLEDGRTRIYFLSTPSNGWENTLFYVDIGNSENGSLEKLKWHRIVDTNFLLTAAGKFSREEQLQWERKRLATLGITSYELHPESGKLVFPAASSLFQCNDADMYPVELSLSTNGAKLNPQICPSNPCLIGYICNNDIWVTHTSCGYTQRLTYVHKGDRSMVDDPISAGVPSYVMQEEFNRFQGFWWQPQCKDDIYRIVYEEVDENEVEISRFPLSKTGETEEFRFPRAGTPNAKWNLKMVQFQINESFQICNVACLELGTPLRTLFHWAEYLVRVGWTPNSEHIWVQLLDRRQRRLELALLAANQFLDTNTISSSEDWRNWTPTVNVICSQVSEVWINVHDILYFFPYEKNSSTLSFIWASEETGWRHLYLFTSTLTPHLNGATDDDHGDGSTHNLKRFLGQSIALTSGDWEVLRKQIWVDSVRELVYFLGLRESPLEKHLYVVSLRQPGRIRLLTKPGHSYSIDINKECTVMVAVYSNIQTLPSCQVFRITHRETTVDGVVLEPAGYLSEPSSTAAPMFKPELYTHQIASGELLYAMVFKPHSFCLGKKYPTVVNVYGGPEVQLVSNTFKGMRQLRMHMLAAQGYCVVAIDSRGSQHRGLAFESHLKGRMGTVELSDQVEVLQWLADSLGFIDINRIAIHGWSYGGYLSLMALVQYPHIFKIAIAGAPVTCWRLYDTGYTERYMDLPEHNVRGYKMGSVLNYTKDFPDEENRLLIIHGLIDENVHFSHTSKFIDAMAKEVKPYELQIYPSERHSLRNLEANQHYETTLLSFLQNNL
ncbi:hypothetical protein RUM44_000900 [Polyplax serrata]|uniref:Dipeptidyl peptidase 9 n=1 Tax=Polyplax serrata TaxID=468196 RepID=A0ABR1B8X1_POLSC